MTFLLVGPEGRRHPLSEDRGHGDHSLEQFGVAQYGPGWNVQVEAVCRECGRRASRSMSVGSAGPAGAVPVSTEDLDSLAMAAVHAFRASTPPSCAEALAQRVMEE